MKRTRTNRLDLVGKTISGVVAAPVTDDGPLKIWLLQFTDGSHVEFVSPGARRTLRELTSSPRGGRKPDVTDAQLALNVA